MSQPLVTTIRVICSGGPAKHVIRELVVLHRRHGRPDLAEMALMAGDAEKAAKYEQFEPGWDVGGSYTSFEPGRVKRSVTKTAVRVVPGRDGEQVIHLPPCPDCGRGRGFRIPVSRLEKLAPTNPGGIDLSGGAA